MTDPCVTCHSCILPVSHAYCIGLLEFLGVDRYQLAGWTWDCVSTRVEVVNFRHSVQNRCALAVPELMKHCPDRRTEMILHPGAVEIKLPSA
jgi:hypothetical protein